MKNLMVLVLAFTFLSSAAFSQKNPPENVKKEFLKKYAAAQSVKWDSEEKNEWEADFSMDGKKMSAVFDDSGKWIESETTITEKELPAPVVSTLNKDFQGYKKGSIDIFEDTRIKGFEISLKKGDKSLEVIIDANGKVVKKEEGEEN